MEYLVTMTTHVPEGTSDAAVQDIRTRESARSRELAAQGHLLRLWRPPLQPGEWRTLGLFAADDDAQLEKVLTSMPLRVWRTDEVTPLSPHPNDPDQYAAPPAAPAAAGGETAGGETAGGETAGGETAGGETSAEFLTTFAVSVPAGTPAQAVEDTEAREAQRARELAGQGRLTRLWKLPGQGRTLGLWRARDVAGMEEILASLPLSGWMSVQTTPLSPHPSDPALTRSS
jgi:muconolactone delta-isomerase